MADNSTVAGSNMAGSSNNSMTPLHRQPPRPRHLPQRHRPRNRDGIRHHSTHHRDRRFLRKLPGRLFPHKVRDMRHHHRVREPLRLRQAPARPRPIRSTYCRAAHGPAIRGAAARPRYRSPTKGGCGHRQHQNRTKPDDGQTVHCSRPYEPGLHHGLEDNSLGWLFHWNPLLLRRLLDAEPRDI